MQSDTEKEYLLKALTVFKRKIIVISKDYDILAANGPFNGMAEKIIIGKKCYEIFYDKKEACENCPATKVKWSLKPAIRSGEIGCIGMERAACRYSYPILDGNRLDAIVMLDFEIPTVEGLEEKLRRSNAFLRNLIMSSVDGVVAADMKGNILIFNDAASEISGYRLEEALTRLNIRDIYVGDGAREVMKRLRSEDCGGKGKLKSYQVEVLRKDKEVIPISLNAAIVYEGEKEVATIGFFHDLRERLKMQEELERTQTQLLQAEKMASLGKLSAGVAHQLNNPLGGIILFSKLMMEEYELPEGAKKDLRRILKDAQRCSDTVKELLEFARQTRQNVQPRDINKAILRTLFLLQNQTLFHNIEIKKNLAPHLPPVPVDLRQINHMFMNIILNAAEAMEGRGLLTVKTYLCGGGDWVCIEFADTGPGVDSEALSHIFEPFFTTKEAGKGTGLGLSMAYGIVENHGGRISARSRPEIDGTSFLIELPIVPKKERGHGK